MAKFRKADGGYSFFEESAERSIYGATVSQALKESDLHGTIMLTWTLAMIQAIRKRLGLNSELSFRLPLNQETRFATPSLCGRWRFPLGYRQIPADAHQSVEGSASPGSITTLVC